MDFDEMTGAVGKGLVAGAVGTAAMTVSSTLEAKLRSRGPSSAPADAAGEVLGVEPESENGKARFGAIVHWGYGTSWGAVRGLYGLAGLTGPAAIAAHFASIWGSAQAMLPALGVAPPAWEMKAQDVAIDAWHHLVYAVATSVAYTALEN